MSPRDVNYNELMQIMAEPVSYVSNQIQQEIQLVAEIEQQIEIEQQQLQQQLEKEALEKEAFELWKSMEENKKIIKESKIEEQKWRDKAEGHRREEQRLRNEIRKLIKKGQILKWNKKMQDCLIPSAYVCMITTFVYFTFIK